MAVKKRSLLVAAILLSQVTARYVPGALIWTSSFWTASTLFFALFTLRTLWSVAIYPRFLDPLRGLPQAPVRFWVPCCPSCMLSDWTQDGSFWLGHFNLIRKQPTGEPQRDWIDHVPNDGVIVYHWFMNEPRVLLTTPKALAEVLVQRSYEFVKPQRMREGLGHILGVGVLLAEGDEHKVCVPVCQGSAPGRCERHKSAFTEQCIETTQSLDARVRVPPHQRPLPRLLGQVARAGRGHVGDDTRVWQRR